MIVGRVVELDPADPGRSAYQALARAAAGNDSPYDTVVSLGAIAAAADPTTAIGPQELLALVIEALADNGRLVFVEPSVGAGARSRTPSRSPKRSGIPILDIPVEVRTAGLTITNLERTPVKTQGRRRWVVDGVAEPTPHIRPLDGSIDRPPKGHHR